MVQPYCPDPDDSDLVFNIPTSENNSPKVKKTGDDVEENGISDSDEAPDDVPFSTSKNAALSVREAEEQVKRKTKEDQKKRRQRKEDLMKEQKEEKLKRLQSLASKRLPEDLVDIISAQPVQQDSGRRQKKMKSHQVARVHTRFDEEHYIPIALEDGSSADFSVAILGSKKWKNKFSKPGYSAPKNFRQQMLFGRSVKRESTKAIQQAQAKQALAGKTGMVGC